MLLVMILALIVMAIILWLLPASTYEIYVGDNMHYKTNLIDDIDRQMKILNQEK